MNYIENARRLRPIIEQAAQPLDDSTALQAVELYPNWAPNIKYSVDFKVQYNSKLYRVIQGHTSQESWTPEAAASLFTEINEANEGTLDNPIPYNGNMVLEKGKYYSQDGVVYLCNRDSINPVYHGLKDLVGLYVETVN